MTESEWLACGDPDEMFQFIDGWMSTRKLRLIVCACCRSVWHLLIDERSRTAVQVSEAFADGEVAKDALEEAYIAAREAKEQLLAGGTAWLEVRSAWAAQSAAELDIAWVEWKSAEGKKYKWEERWWYDLRLNACEVIRDIIDPFKRYTLDQSWLVTHGASAVAMAQSIYREHRFGELQALADVLEEVGCDDKCILYHCRSQTPHAKGCWAIDALLGRE